MNLFFKKPVRPFQKQKGSLLISILLLTTLGSFLFLCAYRENLLYQHWKVKLNVLQTKKLAQRAAHHALEFLSQQAEVDTLATCFDGKEAIPLTQFHNTVDGKALPPIVSKGEKSVSISITKDKTISFPLENKDDYHAIAFGVFTDLNPDKAIKITPCKTQSQGLRITFDQAIKGTSCPPCFLETGENEDSWGYVQKRFETLQKLNKPLSTDEFFRPILVACQIEQDQSSFFKIQYTWWNPYDRLLEGELDIQLIFEWVHGSGIQEEICAIHPIRLNINPGELEKMELWELSVNSNQWQKFSLKIGSDPAVKYSIRCPAGPLPAHFSFQLNADKIKDFQAINLWEDKTHYIYLPFVQPIPPAIPPTPPKPAKIPPWKRKVHPKPSAPVLAPVSIPKEVYKEDAKALWTYQSVPPFPFKHVAYSTKTAFDHLQACFFKTKHFPYAAIGWPHKNPYNDFFWDDYCLTEMVEYQPININALLDSDQEIFSQALSHSVGSLSTTDFEHFFENLKQHINQNRPFLSIRSFIESGLLQVSLSSVESLKHLRQSDFLAHLKVPLALRHEHFVIIGVGVIQDNGKTYQKACKLFVHRSVSNESKRDWIIDGLSWL